MVRGINVDLSFLFRKKKFDQTSVEDTKLSRVLGLMDITALGVSCTLGNGIYVLAGNVIANYSGPSIFLSFLIAGFATFIAGICYAEVSRSRHVIVVILFIIRLFIFLFKVRSTCTSEWLSLCLYICDNR